MFVNASGTRLDLSKSPPPTRAGLLPGRNHVAFFSMRGGHGAEYVVSIDGPAAAGVSPAIEVQASVAWAPAGSQFAVLTGGGQGAGAIHLASAERRGAGAPLRQSTNRRLVGWSPDGTRIAYTDHLGGVEVVSSAGRSSRPRGGQRVVVADGRLAVARDSTTIDVYDH